MKEIDPHLPIDISAKFVVSKCNDQQREFSRAHNISSMQGLPTKEFPGPHKDDLTGRKVGRFTVIGCSVIKSNGGSRGMNRVRWVVKCSCGRYQLLSTKVVKRNNPYNMCIECDKINRPPTYYYNDYKG